MRPALFVLTCLSFLLLSPVYAGAQEKKPVKRYVSLRYFNQNNSMQYLLLSATARTEEGVIPQQGVTFDLYLDTQEPGNLVARMTTDSTGAAKAFIPPALKEKWDSVPKHSFVAIADEGTDEEQSQEIEVSKSRISIDTLNEDGIRYVTATINRQEDGQWVPVPDVDVKVGIRRMGGILSAGDEPTYTTDETGMVKVEFTRDTLPGDTKGNFMLAAKVDDADQIGTLLVEKPVPWGIPEVIQDGFFDQRTLWSTRNHTPLWLLFLAYGIVLSVWGTLIYLLFQLIRIRKLGKTETAKS